MDDKYLITLYQARNEDAIKETETAYGKLLYSIAWHVLADHQRCEECVNDTYLKAWESIPPEIPRSLVAYLGRIVRNLAINRWNAERALKRFNPRNVALGELAEMLPGKQDTAAPAELKVVTESINRWLKTLEPEDRILFVRRYWFGDAVKVLGERYGIPPKQLASRFYRLRESLKQHLNDEELYV